jgi:maltodextrin utilization protein YvdJ
MVVRCIVHQFNIYLLNQPLSSRVSQVVVQPFSSTIKTTAIVFFMLYVVMIVVVHQVLVSSLVTYMCTMFYRARIISIIHQFHVVWAWIQTHGILSFFNMEKFVVHQLIHPWTNVMVDHFIITLSVIRLLPVRLHTPHLQTTSLMDTVAFTYVEQVQNMKSKVATSSETHRLPVQKEQFTQAETWWSKILAFLRTQQLVFSIKDHHLTQSLSRTAQSTQLQIMDTWQHKTQFQKVSFSHWTTCQLEIVTLNMTLQGH